MATKPFIAEMGLQFQTLGSIAVLALAAPIADGSRDSTATTHAARTGFYFPTTTSIGVVTNAAERMRIDGSGQVTVATATTADSLARVLIASGATTSKALVLQGSAAQTADLQQWQDSSGAVCASISSAGDLTKIKSVAYAWPAAQGSESTVLTNDGAGNLSWAAAADTSVAVILLPTTSARNVIQPSDAAIVPLTIKGFAAQSADLEQWQDSTGAVLASVSSVGHFGIGITPTTQLTVAETSTSSPRGILSMQFSTSTDGARVGFAKARGTVAAPTTIVTGDTLGRLMFRGYDGTNYLEMGSIECVSTGTIATNRVPTYLTLSTATNASPSVLTERMRITETGAFGFNYVPVVFDGSIPGFVFKQAGSNAIMYFRGVTKNSKAYSELNLQGGGGQTGQLTLNYDGISGSSTLCSRVVFTTNSPTDGIYLERIGGGTAADSRMTFRYGSDTSRTDFLSVCAAGTISMYGTLTNTLLADSIGVIIKGFSGQTADLQEWQNSSGTILAAISSTGDLAKIKSVAYSWPAAQGSASTVLTNDGSGNLSWAAASGGIGGGIAATQVAYGAATANQIAGNNGFVVDATNRRLGLSDSTALFVPLTSLHLSKNTNTGIRADTYSSTATATAGAQFYRARGTFAAPAAIQANDVMGFVGVYGYYATGGTPTGFSSTSRAKIEFLAANTWSDTSQGASVGLWTTAVGAVAATERVRLYADGGMQIGGTGATWGTSPGNAVLTIMQNQFITPLTGTLLQIVGSNNTKSRVELVATQTAGGAQTAYATFTGRTSRGPLANPSNSYADDILVAISACGYGATAWPTTNKGLIHINAAEAWTDAAQGTYIGFNTTAVGGLVTSEKVRIYSNGGVQIGGTLSGSGPGAGCLLTQAFFMNTPQAVTASATITSGRVKFTGGTAAQTLTLPAGVAGTDIFIRNAGTVAVTVARAGSDTIEGLTTFVLLPGEAISLTFVGTDWTIF